MSISFHASIREPMVELHDVDLNLLVTLDALLQTGSVTGAAARVGLSTPAMSHALARLRRQLGDPVLVRAGQGMVPTPRAEALREPVRELLAGVQAVLQPEPGFDPATADRELRVRASDYVLSTFGSELDQRVSEAAPRLRLRFSPNVSEDPEHVREGVVDLAIGVFRDLPPECRIQTLFEERLVCVVRHGHATIRGRLTLEQFAEAPHVQVAPRGLPGGYVDQVLAREGLHRRVARAVPFFLSAMQLAAGADYVLTVPERLARAWAERFGLRVLEPPLAFEPYAVVQLWHPRHEADEGHRWLRQQVMEAARATRPRRRK
jgi:DNA-binding transcriptional LysR family regulator